MTPHPALAEPSSTVLSKGWFPAGEDGTTQRLFPTRLCAFRRGGPMGGVGFCTMTPHPALRATFPSRILTGAFSSKAAPCRGRLLARIVLSSYRVIERLVSGG